MVETMRAAVLAAPGKVRIETVPIPRPSSGEVRLKLEGCGVCASNLGPWGGLEWLTYPGEPGGLGHEAWGIVDSVGSDVDNLAVGDRVTGLTFRSFADYDIATEDRLLKLPTALDGRPFAGEPLGCAMNIFRRSAIAPGQTVAIIGIGFLGAILTKLSSEAGARVIAISRRPDSLGLAGRNGAADTIVMDDHWAIIEAVKRITGDRMCERVIEAVGRQWPLDLAGDIVAEGGKLIVAGYHQDGPRQVNMQSWNWKGIDVISAHERDLAVNMRGMREAIDAVVGGQIDDTTLYTHRYRLDQLAEALDATRDKPGNFVKALILFGEA
jgi:threonine dehydrogenase-like Zn-dependent dehydrogenase